MQTTPSVDLSQFGLAALFPPGFLYGEAPAAPGSFDALLLSLLSGGAADSPAAQTTDLSAILTQSDSALPDDTPAEGGVAADAAAVLPLDTLLALLAPTPPPNLSVPVDAPAPASSEVGTAAPLPDPTLVSPAEASPNVQALLQHVSELHAQVDAHAPPQGTPATAYADLVSTAGSSADGVATAPSQAGAQSGALMSALAVVPSGDTPLPAITVIESLIPSVSASAEAPVQSEPGTLPAQGAPAEPAAPVASTASETGTTRRHELPLLRTTQPEPEPGDPGRRIPGAPALLRAPALLVTRTTPATLPTATGPQAVAPSTPAGVVVVPEAPGVPVAPPTLLGSNAVPSSPVAFAAKLGGQEYPAPTLVVETGSASVPTVPVTLVTEAAVLSVPVTLDDGAEASLAFDASSGDATEGHSAGQGPSKPSTGPAVTFSLPTLLSDAGPPVAPVETTVAGTVPVFMGEVPAPVFLTLDATHAALTQEPVPQYTSLPHAGDDVVRVAQYLAREHGGTVQLRLHPEALGRITVQVMQDHDVIRVELTVQSHQVREVLQDQLGHLKQQLVDQGLTLSELTVSVSTGNGQEPANQDQDLPQPSGQGSPTAVSAESATDTVAHAPPAPALAGVLDLIA